MKKIVSPILFIIAIATINAQDTIGQLSLKLSGSGLMMDIFDNRDTTRNKDYLPNNPLSGSIGLFYKGFGGYIGGGVSVGDLVDGIKTTYKDFQLFKYYSTIGFDFYYQDYKGYYHDNSNLSIIEKYQNMYLQTYGFNFYYKIFGPGNISLFNNIAKKQTVRMPWIVYTIASLSDRKMNSDIPVLNEIDIYSFPDFKDIKKIEFIIPSCSIGFAFSYCSSAFQITPGLSLGVGYPISKCHLEPIVAVKGNFKTNMQYNYHNMTFGSNITADFDAIIFDNSQGFQFISYKVDLYVGYNLKKSVSESK